MFRFPFPVFLLFLALVAGAARAQDRLTVADAQKALAANPQGADAQALAARIRERVGEQNLKNGTAAVSEGTQVLFAVETDEGEPRLQLSTGGRPARMQHVGDTDLWATVAEVPNFSRVTFQYEVAGKPAGGRTLQIEYYAPHPDSLPQPNVPKGTVTKYHWKSSVFKDTERDYWVYVPAQYSAEKPAAVMVFQDGESYLNGGKVPTVFDNLIAKGDMPVTVAIFINSGTFSGGRSDRSFEYDTLSDQYARFLRDEILPEVGKTVKLTDDPERRAICGISSGGICAWTAAWEMPDMWRKVLSHVGSFTNIASGPTRREGGHNYQALIRKTPRKPIRIWLQDGAQDLDNDNGSWPLAAQEMAASLRYAGYDYRFDYGPGFHSMAQGAATLPDSLRWLWRDVR